MNNKFDIDQISQDLANELRSKIDSAINSAIMEIIISNLGVTYKIVEAVKRISIDYLGYNKIHILLDNKVVAHIYYEIEDLNKIVIKTEYVTSHR